MGKKRTQRERKATKAGKEVDGGGCGVGALPDDGRLSQAAVCPEYADCCSRRSRSESPKSRAVAFSPFPPPPPRLSVSVSVLRMDAPL